MAFIVMPLALLLTVPIFQGIPAESSQQIEADFDGDNLPDRAYLRPDKSTNAQTLIVKFGSGKETRLLNDAGTQSALRLEVRGSGDPRCPNWRPARTCGRNFEIHKGPALAIVHPGERDLIFYWVEGTRFLLERGYQAHRRAT